LLKELTIRVTRVLKGYGSLVQRAAFLVLTHCY
jgi:hypothetical protein